MSKSSMSLPMAMNLKSSMRKKKMAKGGPVDLSAKAESRPKPENEYADSPMANRNSGKKSLPDDQWTDSPTVRQAQKPSLTKLSRPKIIGSDTFSVRNRDMTDDENDFQGKFPPQSDKAQPSSRLDEEDAMKSGPAISDMEHQHGNKKPAYAEGGQVIDEEMPHTGESEADMLRRHADERAAFARGGRVDMKDMDMDEDGADRPNSIADAIMSKKRMADGGMVDLEANSEESPNNEDQMSFEANGKEQYDLGQLDEQPADSNEQGHELSDEDSHDMASQIRKKLKSIGRI